VFGAHSQNIKRLSPHKLNDFFNQPNLRNLVDSLRESVKNLGGFSPEALKVAATTGDELLKRHILSALSDGPKTGFQIIEAIAADSEHKAKPAANKVYPMLEMMVDTGLAKVETKKDRKVFGITAEGTEFLTAQTPIEETSEQSSGFNWDAPKWVDLNGTLAKAGKRVARVSLEVAQHGTKEQQAEAAKVLDEARRKLHNILASE
jgi:DNA-binding PadR family transcriptional regulator